MMYTGAAEAIKRLLVERIGDAFFTHKRRNESADAAIFVRKVGHTQRGGRPILFDRFYASQLGGKAVDLLLQGCHNCVATLQFRDGGLRPRQPRRQQAPRPLGDHPRPPPLSLLL